MAELDKLARVRALELPQGLLESLHPSPVKRLRRRVAVETAWELRRHPDRIRLPLLDAIEAIRAAAGDGWQYHNLADVAVEGVIRPKWRDIVIETTPDGGRRVNRINYELCALQSLRERLRCKEVWVVGADRWRDPDTDLPADFAERREARLTRASSCRATPRRSSPGFGPR